MVLPIVVVVQFQREVTVVLSSTGARFESIVCVMDERERRNTSALSTFSCRVGVFILVASTVL